MLKKLRPKSEFSRNVLTLMTGTTIAQAIPIAISPILTRIYSPEDFGVFALFMSISSIISVVATGRYELAIMLPKKDGDAVNIAVLSILIAFFVSFITFLIVYFFNDRITNLIGNPEISSWLYFIPVTVLLTGIYQSFNYWSNRKQQYKRLAVSRVIQSGTRATANLGMGFGNFGSSGLILGGIMGQGIATITLGKLIWKEDKDWLRLVKKLKIYALIRKYKDFPRINMFHAFINDAKNFIVNIFLIKYYSSFILGQFYMVNRILLLPSSLIGSSVTQVLYRTIVEKYNNKEDFSKDILHIMIKLFLFAFIPFLLMVFFGEEIFGFVFGNNWKIGGEIASSYALYILFHFIASSISIIPIIIQKQKIAFYWNLIGTFLYIMSIIIGYNIFSNLANTLLLLSIVMTMYFLLNFRWIYKISKKEALNG